MKGWRQKLRTHYTRTSNTMLNGVSAALRKCENPPLRVTFSIFAGPACAPKPSPTSCEREHGTQTVADAEYMMRPMGFRFADTSSCANGSTTIHVPPAARDS